MKRSRSVAFAILMLMTISAHIAVAGEKDVLRQIEDRAQIEQLLWRYVRALDTGNAEDYAATFAPDGQFGRDTNATKGREALRKMIVDMRQRNANSDEKSGTKRPAMYHVITNASVEFIDRDRARFNAYWMTVFGGGRRKRSSPRSRSGEGSG